MNKLLEYTRSYEDWIVHKATKIKVEIYPYFQHIYIKPKDIDEIDYLFE